MKFNFRRAVILMSFVNAVAAFIMACACLAFGYWGRFVAATAIICVEAFVIGGLIDD